MDFNLSWQFSGKGEKKASTEENNNGDKISQPKCHIPHLSIQMKYLALMLTSPYLGA